MYSSLSDLAMSTGATEMIVATADAASSTRCMSSTARAEDVIVSTAVATAAGTKCHMFKIDGYKRIKAMYGKGRSIDSCRFEVAGRAWKILFFPNGDCRDTAGHVSLFLKLDDDDTVGGGPDDNDDGKVVVVELRFSLLCRPGWAPDDRPQSWTRTATFTNKGNKTMGYSQFMKRSELEMPRFLGDDCLAIRCDMSVLDDPVDVKEEPAQPLDLQRLGVPLDCKVVDDGACIKTEPLVPVPLSYFKFTEALVKLFVGCFDV
ncbi:MATH domain containing protein [Zea mays]|jgi:speckle-type POZ protein|uniref:MATH domain containing protein n=2 Tax=Zea mays TaxID=4577 RepID=K7U2Z1_MAIZE|nr:MATH domain containing protein [Zea mays]